MKDPLDELVEMDRQEREAHQLTDSVVGSCDPICELCHNDGDPGRGKIDAPGSGDGWTEAGSNPEESLVEELDNLVDTAADMIFK